MHTTQQTIFAFLLAGALAACGQGEISPTDTQATSPSPMATATPAPESRAPAATSDASAPEGWERVVISDQGFSVALPEAWEPLTADALTESGALDEILEANPDATGPIEQARTAIMSGQLALFAFDGAAENIDSGFTANVNAINVGPVEGSAADAADAVAAEIEQQVPVTGEVETDTVTLPAGEAARIRYDWSVVNADGVPTNVSVTQYAIIGRSSGYVLSMSAATETAADYEEVFRQIAESFVEDPT
jgi:hypothetical protein